METKFSLDVQLEEITADSFKKAMAGMDDSEIPQLDPDLMYVRFIMCHEGPNSNGDTFLKEVLKQAQATPKNKPINWEHGEPKIGNIIDSTYREDANGRAYIEAIGVIWKFLHPDLAEEVKAKASTGELRLSMECYYKDSDYSYAGQLYDQETARELKLDEHVGREFAGQKVFRIFKEVVFGGVAVVAKPADREAVFLSVAKKNEEESEIDAEHLKSIAEIIRTTNDFNKKMLDNETLDAVTAGKYVRAFDDAKSRIVSKLNKEHLEAKAQTLQEIKNIVNELLKEVSYISNDYFVGVASEQNEQSNEGIDLKLSEDSDIEIEAEKGGSNEMEDNKEKELEQIEEKEEKEAQENFKELEKEEDFKGLASDLQKKVDELELEKAEAEAKADKYQELEAKYNALLEKVEASEKEALLNSRMAELDELGVKFSEARLEKEKAKISEMDADSYADYKEFLSELVVKAEDKQEDEEEKEEDKEEEIEITKPEQAQAGLIVEAKDETPKVITPFGHLGN